MREINDGEEDEMRRLEKLTFERPSVIRRNRSVIGQTCHVVEATTTSCSWCPVNDPLHHPTRPAHDHQ